MKLILYRGSREKWSARRHLKEYTSYPPKYKTRKITMSTKPKNPKKDTFV